MGLSEKQKRTALNHALQLPERDCQTVLSGLRKISRDCQVALGGDRFGFNPMSDDIWDAFLGGFGGRA